MKIKSFILWFLFLIVDKTCHWRYQGQDNLNKLIESDSPILLCMWHGNFIFPMIYFKRFLPQIQVVSSTHNDSNILANVLKKYGFYLIKGSSSRGAKNVLKEMIAAYKKSDSIIAITNDGPKGPPRIAKEGSVTLAYKLNAHIVFMTGRASNFWKIKTWDCFIFPKPTPFPPTAQSLHLQHIRYYSVRIFEALEQLSLRVPPFCNEHRLF